MRKMKRQTCAAVDDAGRAIVELYEYIQHYESGTFSASRSQLTAHDVSAMLALLVRRIPRQIDGVMLSVLLDEVRR